MSLKSRYIDNDVLKRLGPVEFEVRNLVEGLLAGVHKSPYLGYSVEFAQHRPYVPGDDIRHIDWKVYARTGRYIVKQYHEETNFVATLLLDCSGSMDYGSGGSTKFEWACRLSAALSYLVLRQHDAVSLGVFDRRMSDYVPPRTQIGFLELLGQALERAQPRGPADLGVTLAEMGERVERRGIVIILSDLLDDPEILRTGLRALRQRNHEVILVHVLDPAELEFPFEGNIRFEGMEETDALRADARRLREAYLEELNAHLHQIRRICDRLGVDYALAPTGHPIEEFLLQYLAVRRRRFGGRG